MTVEKDVVKVLLATVTAVTILNILRVGNGSAATSIAGAVFGGWTKVLGVLSQQTNIK